MIYNNITMSCVLITNLPTMSNCDAISPLQRPRLEQDISNADLVKMIQDMIQEEFLDSGNRIISRISVPFKTVPDKCMRQVRLIPPEFLFLDTKGMTQLE